MDDDEEDDDEDDKHSALGSNPSDADPPADVHKHQKRHATVNLEHNTESVIPQRNGEYSMLPSARRGDNHHGAASSRRTKTNGPPTEGMKGMMKQQHMQLSQQVSWDYNGGGGADGKGFLGQLMQRMRGALRRNSNAVTPLPTTSSDGQQQLLGISAKRKLKYDSPETFLVLTPFVMWSLLVIVIYAVCVSRIMGIVEVVAVHSVANFLAARTYRAVFYSQELVANDDPTLLASHRAAVAGVHKVVRDAWYTLQLGKYAYIAAGPDTERFPYVIEGMAYASPELTDIFYETGRCHRSEGACPADHKYRFYQITRTSLDSMMQQYLVQLESLARDQGPNPPGMSSPEFDFIYNVGTKDLIGGASEIQETHLNTILGLFHGIFVLHTMLFIQFWIIFGGFLVLLLFPLLKRVSRERRRVAELLSQLPLELDVEKLVARALGATLRVASNGPAGPAHVQQVVATAGALLPAPPAGGQGNFRAIESSGDLTELDTASRWKAIIRSASQQAKAAIRRSNTGEAASVGISSGAIMARTSFNASKQ
ncbi:hypothetical protein Vretifemale_9902 [Volvox reticuliferus]|uniref:Uncharacterized protein n=1 Tax=Volvox reticuliferus TaxID=1737510 RepID=A0A8J4CDY4_9CHLO|nr:hypothetical protein Vretifemale_9902 [Volvox reticuliferus]